MKNRFNHSFQADNFLKQSINDYICANLGDMKKFWIAICFMFILLFTGGIAETAFSMNVEEIEAMSQTSNKNTNYVDGNSFHNTLAAIEINSYSSSQQGVNLPRVKRAVSLQISSFFKNVSRCLSDLDSASALNSGRFYNAVTCSVCDPFSKHYYVFALRRIII